ncbi:MAG: hypothetical protein QOH41_1084 [Blastocatellia bacterium]|nr:hypothetical protein [Blastocatellia bacterium]
MRCRIAKIQSEIESAGALKCWRPVRESNPCRRREREATYCNSTELSGMDSTLPQFKDSRESLLDA